MLLNMTGSPRFFEIDLLRGIAIAMMVLFHTLFDLFWFGIYPVTVTSGFWQYFTFGTATLFLLVVGISFTISYARAARRLAPVPLYLKFLKRGAGIFALGLLVTLATWLYLGEGFIVFGILHLIGVSIILAPLFFPVREIQSRDRHRVHPDRVPPRRDTRPVLASPAGYSPGSVDVG